MSVSRKIKSSEPDEWRFVVYEDGVEVITDESERESSSDEGKETVNEGEYRGAYVGSISDREAVGMSYSADEVAEENESEEDEIGSIDKLSASEVLFGRVGELDDFHGEDDGTSSIFDVIKTSLLYGALVCVLLAILCSLFVTSFLLLNGNFPEGTVNKENRISKDAFHELEEALSKLQSALRLNDNAPQNANLKRPPSQRVLNKLMTSVQQIESQISERIDSLAAKRSSLPNDGKEDEQKDANVIIVSKNVIAEDQNEIPSPNVKEEIPLDHVSALNEESITLEGDSKLAKNAQPDDKRGHTSKDFGRVVQFLKNEVIQTQKLIYSQIMSSLFEYKTNAYKNLLRSGLSDYLSPERTDDGDKFESKHVILLQKLQDLISDSSTSHFNWWYEFYFNAVDPKFQDIILQLDSLSEEFVFKTESFELTDTDSRADDTVNENEDSDSFFVRATSDRQLAANGGFDWSNLPNKLKEIVKNAEVKSSDGYNKSEPLEGLANTNGSEWKEAFDNDERGNNRNEGETYDKKPEAKRANLGDKLLSNEKNDENPKNRPTVYVEKDPLKFHPYIHRRYRDSGHKKGRPSESKSNFKNLVHRLKSSAKKAASGLLKLMKRGVKNYEDLVDGWRPKKVEDAKKHDLWRSEFVKEMKDVLNLVPKNPLVVSLNEFQFKAMQFLNDGIGKMINDVDSPSEQAHRQSQYCGDSTESDSSSENEECDRVYNEPSKKGKTSGWWFDLSRHRSKARERLNHGDGWFTSLARHRAQMRRQHRTEAFAPYPASPKR